MCSRGYYFLDKLTFRYCTNGGSSAAIREWMKKNLIDFSKSNPQLKVVTSVVPNRHPILIGEYKNGLSRQICVKNMSQKDIWEHVMELRNTNGHKVSKVTQSVYTNNPSYQGVFDDYLRTDSIKVKQVPNWIV
ncbi:putative mitochondrial ribosomal protein [Blastocystis sp. subtype 4]|uniref:putative mitochondrial ribosomal protein n=1 Tax=Blastocystis sp. subtype 4 TaxID=944170 RepID=UPI000711F5DE|nr:putative mitochondrial ribosomal protein [Blastocystis sp. subtype 4]KNB43914.1 putative mitochondrial ribosomal protein [Blastocystis sp. subtype 4]|eukprot:XP_014527357.1 putative mitochondrial ribosomal protein [Blastocystis sp. subtype 4]